MGHMMGDVVKVEGGIGTIVFLAHDRFEGEHRSDAFSKVHVGGARFEQVQAPGKISDGYSNIQKKVLERLNVIGDGIHVA